MIKEYEATLPFGGWPNWVLGNHDQPRVASRLGRAQARVAAMLLLTLRGTPTLYYGDELGMQNVPIPPEKERDPFGKNMPGTGQGRDPERTPMRWDTSSNAGFTSGEPWLPLGDDWPSVNVEVEQEDQASMLCLIRSLFDLRRREPALSQGDYHTRAIEGDVLVYRRSGPQRSFIVALNFEPLPKLVLFAEDEVRGRIAVSTHADRHSEEVSREIALRPDEGVLIELAG